MGRCFYLLVGQSGSGMMGWVVGNIVGGFGRIHPNRSHMLAIPHHPPQTACLTCEYQQRSQIEPKTRSFFCAWLVQRLEHINEWSALINAQPLPRGGIPRRGSCENWEICNKNGFKVLVDRVSMRACQPKTTLSHTNNFNLIQPPIFFLLPSMWFTTTEESSVIVRMSSLKTAVGEILTASQQIFSLSS